MTARIRILTAILLAVIVSACGDGSDDPVGGAGIRLIFPEWFITSQEVRVTLLDPDQAHPPLLCEAASRRSSPAFAPQDLGDGCDSLAFSISNLVGKRVFYRAFKPGSGETAWDGRDDDGNLVPAGYYIYHFKCLSSDEFDVRTGFYLAREPSGCEWPLWSETLETGVRTDELEFGPFPTRIELPVTDPGSPDVIGTITFDNPFLIRVEVPSTGAIFEQKVILTGRFTEVHVTFLPAR